MASPDTIVPDHKDISHALSATLATHRGQPDVLPLLASQFTSAADADRFVAALLSAFAGFVACKTENPEDYLLGWIALTLEIDAAEQAGRDSDGNSGTDVN